jgi:hypothetical protein
MMLDELLSHWLVINIALPPETELGRGQQTQFIFKLQLMHFCILKEGCFRRGKFTFWPNFYHRKNQSTFLGVYIYIQYQAILIL